MDRKRKKKTTKEALKGVTQSHRYNEHMRRCVCGYLQHLTTCVGVCVCVGLTVGFLPSFNIVFLFKTPCKVTAPGYR